MIFKVITKHEANVIENNNLSLWHQRLARINGGALRKMINKELVNGIKISNDNAFFCECCVLGKQHRLPFMWPYAYRFGGRFKVFFVT